jgi:hypothetical protein
MQTIGASELNDFTVASRMMATVSEKPVCYRVCQLMWSSRDENGAYQRRPDLVADRLLVELIRVLRKIIEQGHSDSTVRIGIELDDGTENGSLVLGGVDVLSKS